MERRYICLWYFGPPSHLPKVHSSRFLKFLQDSCFSTPLSVWNNSPGPEFRSQSRGWVVGVVWNDVIYFCDPNRPLPTHQKVILRVFQKSIKVSVFTHRFQCGVVPPGLNFVSNRWGGWLESCETTFYMFVIRRAPSHCTEGPTLCFSKFLQLSLFTHRCQCRLVSPGLNFVSNRGRGWLESCGTTLCIFVTKYQPPTTETDVKT